MDFSSILLHLEILEDDEGFASQPEERFFESQKDWKREVKQEMAQLEAYPDAANAKLRVDDLLRRRREQELKHAEDVRRLYEERLNTASTLLAELKAKTKALEQ